MVDAQALLRPLTRAEITGLTLGKAKDLALSLLQEAVLDATSPLHVAVLASLGSEGPEARSVILRALGQAPLALTIWTDNRAAKVAEMRTTPAISLVLYDPRRAIQLRLKGQAMLESDPVRLDRIWRDASLASRRAYLVAATPGAALDMPHSGLPEALDDALPTPDQVERGRKNFGVIEIVLSAIDLLILGRNGHRRATLSPRPDGLTGPEGLTGQWRVP